MKSKTQAVCFPYVIIPAETMLVWWHTDSADLGEGQEELLDISAQSRTYIPVRTSLMG
jgi:hypothetical protein